MNPEYGASEGPLHAFTRSRTLAQMAAAVQPALRALLDGEGGSRRWIKDALHGTFTGHPLHPPLTDIPVGAWTVAAVCDALGLTGTTRFHDAADIAILIGAGGATAAAATGLADWSDASGEPQRVGMLHALLNSVALATYLGSLVARRSGARGFGVAAAFAAYGMVCASAYLGGELSLGMQLGVKHTAVPVEPPADFVRALDESALTGELMHAASADGIPLLVTRAGLAVHAVSGVCTHRGAPLADGTQEGRCVRCPWHGSRFSLDDGSVAEGPATFGLAAFETRVAEGSIDVRAPQA